MLKRTLSALLLVCIMMQAVPVAVFAEALEGDSQEDVTEIVAPEDYEICELNAEDGTVSILSPDERSALVLVTHYKNEVFDRVYAAEAELAVGRNKVKIPDYAKDDTATVKVVLWDSIDKIMPLCDSLEIGAELFDVNFETGLDGVTVSKRTYPSNARFGKLPTPLIDSHMFVGWYYDNGYSQPVTENDIVNSNCTLYAKMLDLSKLYSETDTMFAERYVANPEAQAVTSIIILSDDVEMSAERVKESIIAENLSIPEKEESFIVNKCTVEGSSETLICEEGQRRWLDSAQEDTVFFVFYAEGGFAEGNSYRITLNDDSLSFAGHSQTARDYNMSVSRTTMSNLSLRDDIVFVSEELVNDVNEEIELSGVAASGKSVKSINRFSLGTGKSGEKLVLSNSDGKREIVLSSGSNNLPEGSFIISGDANATPEELNDKTVAVYGQNDNGDNISLSAIGNLTLPENLDLDGSALWNMDYRTIEGQIDGDYVYTDTDSKSILFKPDVFPITDTEGFELGFATDMTDDGGTDTGFIIGSDTISPEATFTDPVENKTLKYSEFGITEETTVDVGDFIVFLSKNEDEKLSNNYVRIDTVNEEENGDYRVTYTSVTEQDVLSSMDMYGERELSAKELTGRDDFTDVEEQAELQAINSGFADNTAMYVSSVMVASEAFADLSKDFELNYEEICEELITAEDFSEIMLLGASDSVIYESKDGALKVYKPDVEATVETSFDVNGAAKAGIKLNLTVKGDITIDLGKNPVSTITISYETVFEQTLRAEIVMNAEASVHYVWIIPIIDDCIINANIDFYTSSDAKFKITAGLTSESTDESTDENSEKVWYAPKSGERYHLDGCTHEREYITFVPIEEAKTLVNNGILLTPCLDCKPQNSNAKMVWYAPTSGERYHLDGCSQETRFIVFASIQEVRNMKTPSGGKYLPCERCQPEEKVYVTPYGECYHRKNCAVLKKDNASGKAVATTIPVAQEEGKYKPCSQCCPGELFAENLTADLKELLDKIDGIRETVTNAVNTAEELKGRLDEMRETLGDSASQEPEEDGSTAEQEDMPSSLVAEKLLIDRYQTLLSNSYADWAEIYRLKLFSANVFTFWGIVNVSVAMDFCLYANLNLAMEADLHYENARRYVFTIYAFKGEVNQEDYELIPEQVRFDFTAMGTAGIKLGVELAIGLNFISDRVGQVTVTGEVGIYVKMWGYFKYHYQNTRPQGSDPITETSCHGALYLEAGPYLEVGLSASLIDKEWSPTLFYKEYPIVKVGERNAVIGFADTDRDTEYVLRKNYKTLVLPSELFSVVYLDLRTGSTGTTSYFDDLKNAKQVSKVPFAYISDRYMLAINNDGNDNVFRFNPSNASIEVVPDSDPEETAELIITYNLPAYAFNRTAITKKVKLYWDNYGDAHVIAFNTTGGEYVAPIIERSDKTIQLPTPVRAGYDFCGWSYVENPTDDQSYVTLDTMQEEDITLYAVWEPGMTTYTVNHWQYDLEGIPQLYETESFEAKTESEVSPEPKSGGEYKGFETPQKHTVKVKGDGSTTVDYYYTRKIYTYELHVQDYITRRLVRYGTPIVLTGREMAGYEFKGWYDDIEGGNSIHELLDKEDGTGTIAFNYEFDYDLTLYARLEPLDTTPYLIEFYSYQESEISTGGGDAYIIYTEQIGALQCYGTTDTQVDLTLDPAALDLTRLRDDNVGSEAFWAKEGFKLEEWQYNAKIDPDLAKGTIYGNGLLVLRAYYEKAKNSIVYKAESFSKPTALVEVNDQIPLPDSNPQKVGYTFGGWKYYTEEGELAYRVQYVGPENPDRFAAENWIYYRKDETEPIVADKKGVYIPMPRKPYTTEAIWTAKEYTVTLKDYEGAPVRTIEATYGETLPVVTPPTRAGYIFEGYYKGQTHYYDNKGKPVDERYLCTEKDVVLTAKWNPIDYTIIYKLNDSELSKAKNSNPDSYTVISNFKFADPTRTGYVFEGWYTSEDFSEENRIERIVEGQIGELTVYAKWDGPHDNTIKYELHGGIHNENNSTKFKYTVEEKPEWTLYEPSRTGYTFVRWIPVTNGVTIADPVNEGEETTWLVSDNREVREGEISFDTEWKLNEYTATWSIPEHVYITVERSSSLNKNVTVPSILSSGDVVYYGDKLSITYSVDKGYICNYGETYITVNSDISDKQIFAIPKPNKFTVKYKWWSDESQTPSSSINYSECKTEWTYDETGTLPTPTLIGWAFGGWYADAGFAKYVGAGGATVKNLATEGEVTLYAKWKANEYTVIYEWNKPQNTLHSVNYSNAQTDWTYDKAGTLPNPTLIGWTFGGWYADAGFTKYVGAGGATVKNLATEGEVTLYAKWEANTYKVSYNRNRPEKALYDVALGVTSPSDWTYDKTGTLPTPTLKGWTFGGWYADAGFTKYVGAGGATVKNLATEGEVTLYAKWTAITYTVTFDNIDSAGLLKFAEVRGTYTGHNMTIDYEPKTRVYTLTNLSDLDPYATIGQEVYLKANTTYYAHMETEGPVQMFYAIGGAYTETNSVRFNSGQKVVVINNVQKTGTYKIRFDTEEKKALKIKIKNFWISESNPTTKIEARLVNENMANIAVPTDGDRRDFGGYYYNGKQYYNSHGQGVCPYEYDKNITLTARWTPQEKTAIWEEPQKATILVNRIDSIYGAPNCEIKNGETPVYCGDVLEIKYTEKPGYSISDSGKATITVTGNISSYDIFAKTTANEYTVTYHANGGSGSTAQSTHKYDSTSKLTANGFSRTNYTFLGWSRSSNATVPDYGNEATVKNLTTSGTVNLYAVWVKTSASIVMGENEKTRHDHIGTGNDTIFPGMNRAQLLANGYTKLYVTVSAQGRGTTIIAGHKVRLDVRTHEDVQLDYIWCGNYNGAWGSWLYKDISFTIDLVDDKTGRFNTNVDGSFWVSWKNDGNDGYAIARTVYTVTAVK